jgi:hypothetical protein
LEIFKQFWASGNHETQWQFILKNTEIIEPKVMKIQRKRNRNRTLVYYLPSKSDACLVTSLKVCKTMFLNTLDIKERTVYTAIDKYANGDQIKDLRGKHTNRPHRTVSETEQSVIQHIQSIPCIESHYLRKSSSRQYFFTKIGCQKMKTFIILKWQASIKIIKYLIHILTFLFSGRKRINAIYVANTTIQLKKVNYN